MNPPFLQPLKTTALANSINLHDQFWMIGFHFMGSYSHLNKAFACKPKGLSLHCKLIFGIHHCRTVRGTDWMEKPSDKSL